MDMTQNYETQPTDIEVLKKMEDEHLRLHRQFRMIQVDRLHRTMGVHPQFRRQDELLRILKKEYNNLCKDLKIARSGAHKKKDKRMKVDLKNSLLQREEVQQEAEAKWSYYTKKANLEERRSQSEHRLVSAENKLETAKLRFNTIQCENKKIRLEIDHMLQDRALFNQSWEKMLAALCKGKKFLDDLFESSTLAYDQRDEWCAKLRTMQEKGRIDQMLQVQEMRDLVKAFDHEMKVYSFLATKGLTRVNRKQEKREELQKRRDEENSRKQNEYHMDLLDSIAVSFYESTLLYVAM
ncbi:hypothetical protein B5X24_HaOG202495 [Helicoverpa armigera]|uniref:ODAD1 central coiled coil region domain-containing protein n=1 Tax=Helicoverpa armigera TaxID=29058 RepID=A0A2W1BX92_HELAM|nr:hypothetical protein B5X24_HaOG202495 [Helicoverpa armigera]